MGAKSWLSGVSLVVLSTACDQGGPYPSFAVDDEVDGGKACPIS